MALLQVAFVIDFEPDCKGGFKPSLGSPILQQGRTDAVAFHHPIQGEHGPLIQVWSHGLDPQVPRKVAEELCIKLAQEWDDTDGKRLGACTEYWRLVQAQDPHALLNFVSRNYSLLPHNARGPCIMGKGDIGDVSKNK